MMRSRLLATSVLLAATVIATSSYADPVSDKAEPPVSNFSPEISSWADSVGDNFRANSTALGEFNSWVHSRSEAHERGYVVAVNDSASGSTNIFWNGSDWEEKRAFEDRAGELGIDAHFSDFPYTFGQVQGSLAGLRSAQPEFEKLSFSVDLVAALSLDEMESVILKGHFTDENVSPDALKSLADLVRSTADSASGILPVKVEISDQGAETYTRRVADNSPFWAGGLMKSSSYCSNGFAVSVDGRSRSTTARHCIGHFTAVEGSGDYGNSYSPTFNGGRLLDSSGSGRVFDGAPSASKNSGVPVKGFQDLNPGDFVCTQGGQLRTSMRHSGPVSERRIQ